MSSYDFDYTIVLLRQAVDFAEVERDFVPLRKWVNEVEQSGRELEAMDGRLNLPAGQDVILATMRSVASGTVSPEDALLSIRRWLNCGELQIVATELTRQEQFA
jgi:hypothetical protein